MSTKDIAIQKLRECDLINGEIIDLRKREQTIRTEINELRTSIEEENKFLIGRKAICSSSDDLFFKDKECVCDYVFCTDSFDIKPIFSRKGKVIHVDFYEWI